MAHFKPGTPLLSDVYALIAVKQRRQHAVFVRRQKTDFTFVLKKLQNVGRVSDAAEQADRMWERLFEFALFLRSKGRHRKPSEILTSFIKTAKTTNAKLSSGERAKLANVFDFISEAYKNSDLAMTRLATDQTHFYTMVTSFLMTKLIEENDSGALTRALNDFGKGISASPEYRANLPFSRLIKPYMDLSEKQTSDTSKREQRQDLFVSAIKFLITEEERKS